MKIGLKPRRKIQCLAPMFLHPVKATLSGFVQRRPVKRAFMTVLALLSAASVPLWVKAASAFPYAFRQETPMSKLPNPVDFSRLVYAESGKTVDVSFWDRYGDHLSLQPHSSTTVDTRDTKVHYKIQCDPQQHTATVHYAYADNVGRLEEGTYTFQIAKYQPPCICLVNVSTDGVVDVITMSGDIGSFIDTVSSSPGSFRHNGTTVMYGTCRN
jgi:hypothetical protein